MKLGAFTSSSLSSSFLTTERLDFLGLTVGLTSSSELAGSNVAGSGFVDTRLRFGEEGVWVVEVSGVARLLAAIGELWVSTLADLRPRGVALVRGVTGVESVEAFAVVVPGPFTFLRTF